MNLLLLFLTLALSSVFAAPAEDLITNLPGLEEQPTFKQYSGYLQGVGGRQLHYWFVESSSNPSTDPIALWMNGGPGCSSLDGFLTEHGPFTVQPDGVTLKPNPFAWNQVASMIYLEAPAGVGFSYYREKNYTTNDDFTAQNNHLALQDFFRKFPEYQSHDFYITGESYGGIYVPTLASLILDDSSINLKGFAVGNGLSDDKMNDNSIVYFAYFHGLIGQSSWDSLIRDCCPKNFSGFCDFAGAAAKSISCSDALAPIQALVWASGLDVYNLYAECAGGVQDRALPYFDPQTGKFKNHNFGWPFAFLKDFKQKREKLLRLPVDMVDSSPPCINSTSSHNYLNNPVVRTAIHIPNFVQTWDICSNEVGSAYHRQYTTMTPQYLKAIDRKMRILIYNGDIDMACNFLGDEWFADSLHKGVKSDRKPWYYKAADSTRQVAGYVKTFDTTDVTVVTVKGAGHMVPTDKPRPALDMFVNFIQDKPYN